MYEDKQVKRLLVFYKVHVLFRNGTGIKYTLAGPDLTKLLKQIKKSYLFESEYQGSTPCLVRTRDISQIFYNEDNSEST